MRKSVETRSLLSNTIKDTSTIMRNPSLHIQTKGYTCMIVLVCLIVLLRRLLVSIIFRMVHPYIAIHSLECRAANHTNSSVFYGFSMSCTVVWT